MFSLFVDPDSLASSIELGSYSEGMIKSDIDIAWIE